MRMVFLCFWPSSDDQIKTRTLPSGQRQRQKQVRRPALGVFSLTGQLLVMDGESVLLTGPHPPAWNERLISIGVG